MGVRNDHSTLSLSGTKLVWNLSRLAGARGTTEQWLAEWPFNGRDQLLGLFPCERPAVAFNGRLRCLAFFGCHRTAVAVVVVVVVPADKAKV